MEHRYLIDNKQKLQFIAGKDTVINFNACENASALLVGTPGCGKTLYTLLVNVLNNLGESMIIDDKKGSLYDLTNEILKTQGYETKVLNLKNFTGDFKFNIFDGIKYKTDIRRIVHFLIPDEKIGNDPFWIDSARILLSSIIGIGLADNRPFTLRRLFEFLNMLTTEVDPKTGLLKKSDFEEYILNQKENGIICAAQEEYRNIRNSATDTWKSICISCISALEYLYDERLFELTDETTLDVKRIGEEKVALYLISSDTDSSLDSFIKLFYKKIVNELIEYADSKENKYLENHVRFMLDDFASGVIIDNFDKVLANCRSRNISFILCIQSLAQLKGLYGDKTEALTDCINYKLYYPSANYVTQTYMAELLDIPISDVQKFPANKLVFEQIYCEPRIIERYDNPWGLITMHKVREKMNSL